MLRYVRPDSIRPILSPRFSSKRSDVTIRVSLLNRTTSSKDIRACRLPMDHDDKGEVMPCHYSEAWLAVCCWGKCLMTFREQILEPIMISVVVTFRVTLSCS